MLPVRILDLYSGMGGLSLGFVLGIEDVKILGFDIDDKAVETYNLNLNRFNAKSMVLDVLEWNPIGDFDLIIGGVPCQPYSLANTKKRGRQHELYPTLPKFFDAVLALKPKAFLMENVKGLITDVHKPLLDEQLKRIEDRYTVKYQVLNAVHYGVPQIRERLFVLGVRRDLGVKPSFPNPTHWEFEKQTLTGRLYRWVTVGEAIGDLLGVTPNQDTRISEHVLLEGSDPRKYNYDWGSRVISLDKPSYTITTKHRCGQVIEGVMRKLTVREALRIQSFPDWWRFPSNVSISKKYELVGEAMPPILAYRLAVHIGRLLGLRTREPPRQEEWKLPYFHRSFQDYFKQQIILNPYPSS